MSQREAGRGAGMKQKYTIWPRGQERPRILVVQCVGAGCRCAGKEMRGPRLEACSGRATSGGRGQWAGKRTARPVPLRHAKRGQLTPGEEVRIRAPEREKRVRIEPLRRARNLLGFATFQVAEAGLYYSATG